MRAGALASAASHPGRLPLHSFFPPPRDCEAVTKAAGRQRYAASVAFSRHIFGPWMWQLAPEARAVVVLRDIEELDYAQIAKILEVPSGTVKSRLFRARMALREGLLDRDGEV